MSKVKRTKIEMLEMEKIVYKMILKGWSFKKIAEELQTKHGYRSLVNCEKIYYKTIKNITPKLEIQKENLREKYIEMYQDLYSKAIEAGDIKNANKILDSIVKIEGLITQNIEGKIETVYTIEY